MMGTKFYNSSKTAEINLLLMILYIRDWLLCCNFVINISENIFATIVSYMPGNICGLPIKLYSFVLCPAGKSHCFIIVGNEA